MREYYPGVNEGILAGANEGNRTGQTERKRRIKGYLVKKDLLYRVWISGFSKKCVILRRKNALSL